MNKALSLHIGLNFVNPKHYKDADGNDWDGELASPEFDAKDMSKIAKSQGFKPQILLTKRARAKSVITAIEKLAIGRKAGDTILITYAGHGGQTDDLNGDEGKFGDARDRKDETWCLYDRELIDDELAALWAKFPKGVRILVLSDSCHSASVTRGRRRVKKRRTLCPMPREIARSVYKRNKGLYDAIQGSLTGSEVVKIQASVISISGCMDNQESNDGDFNGLFTETLKDIWADGKFEGGYETFRDTIAAEMPDYQTPTFFRIGKVNKAFEKEKPFTPFPPQPKRTRAKKKTARRSRSARKPKAQPIEVVLKALDETGYTDSRDGGPSRPDSKIKTWFRRVDKEDEALAIPTPQRTAQFVLKVQGALGIPVSAADLIAGVYRTPQDIADLV